MEDDRVNSSNIQLIPKFTVVYGEIVDKSNYPVIPSYHSKNCGCDCMLKQGSYTSELGYKSFILDGLFTYDENISYGDFV